MLPIRDKRTVYLQELAIYEAIVALVILRIGTPPFWFFAAQGAGHLLSALVWKKSKICFEPNTNHRGRMWMGHCRLSFRCEAISALESRHRPGFSRDSLSVNA